MEPLPASQPKDLAEYRRFRVLEMHRQGYKQQQIADALGLTQSGVCRILARAQKGGPDALLTRKAPGAKPRLTNEQKAQLPEKLLLGAEAFGFRGDLWTCERIAEVIKREFGVSSSRLYRPLAPRLRMELPKADCTRHPTQRRRHPKLGGRAPAGTKKKAKREGYTLLFIDELAFYLLPGVRRTWSPVGCTPVSRCKLTRDHFSVISAVTPAGELYLHLREEAFDSVAIIAFLEQLLAAIEGKLLIIWDGAPIHRSKVVKQYLAEGGAERILLERLPGYAPELNPDEGIWHYLKHVELKNVCSRDMPHLREELLAAEQRLRAKPEIIRACFEQVGYYDETT